MIKAFFEVYKILGRLGIKPKDVIGMGGDVVRMGKSLFNTRVNPKLLQFIEKNGKIPAKILEDLKIHARTLKNTSESQKNLFQANIKDILNAKTPKMPIKSKPPVTSIKQPATSVKDAAEAFKGWKPTVIKGGKDGLATGGRAGYSLGSMVSQARQENDGIEERLEQLGGDVTSAEQMLQQINQRLQTTEGGIGSLPTYTPQPRPSGLASFDKIHPDFKTGQPMAQLPGVGPNVGNEIATKYNANFSFGDPNPNTNVTPYPNIPQQYKKGFAEYTKENPIGFGGQAISSVGIPGGGSVSFGDTGSAGAFRDYLSSIGFNSPSPLGQPLGQPSTTMNTPDWNTAHGGALKGLDMSGFKPPMSAQQDVQFISINGNEITGNGAYVGSLSEYLNSTGQGDAISSSGLLQAPLLSSPGGGMQSQGPRVLGIGGQRLATGGIANHFRAR